MASKQNTFIQHLQCEYALKRKEYKDLPWWALIRKFKLSIEMDNLVDILYIAIAAENNKGK